MIARDELFNPLDPEVLKDPYTIYRRLRESHPVYWHEQLHCWVLTRYADCASVLRDSNLFANDFRRIGIPTPPPVLSLQSLDPPEQTPLRNFAVSALRAQDLSALERDTAAIAEQLLEELALRDTIDFVHDFADPFTLKTISRLLGVDPPQTGETWVRLNDDLDRSMDSGLVPGTEQAGLEARAVFSALVAGWLASGPKRGLLRYILDNRDRANVSDEILINSVRAFWHAGFEVPSRFLGNAMLALLRHPGAMAGLRRAESLDLAVEELVRYAGPVQAVSRACTQDARLNGQRIEKGNVVIVFIAAANRDPEQFDDPDELVLSRRASPNLGFGKGAHSCLGLQVARMEARVVISTFLRRYPDLRLAGEPVPRANATLRGLATLPVALSRG
jgi:hypothetical protein